MARSKGARKEIKAKPRNAEGGKSPAGRESENAKKTRAESAPWGGKKTEPPPQDGKAQTANERKHWLEYATAIFALIAAIAAASAAGFTFWQGWITRETARTQQRAYVFIRGGRIQLSDDGMAISGVAEVQNFGQTPGYDFETWTDIRVGRPNDDPFDQLGDPVQRSIIGPSADLSVPSGWVPLSPKHRQAINAGTLVAFVWGYARYTDAFGRRWEFIFRARNASEPERNIVNTITGQVMGMAGASCPIPVATAKPKSNAPACRSHSVAYSPHVE